MSIKVAKNYLTRKMKDFDTFKNCLKIKAIWANLLPKNKGNLGKIIAATGSEKLPKVYKIAQSGHTGYHLNCSCSIGKKTCNVLCKIFY